MDQAKPSFALMIFACVAVAITLTPLGLILIEGASWEPNLTVVRRSVPMLLLGLIFTSTLALICFKNEKRVLKMFLAKAFLGGLSYLCFLATAIATLEARSLNWRASCFLLMALILLFAARRYMTVNTEQPAGGDGADAAPQP